jgi:hypothetical protein
LRALNLHSGIHPRHPKPLSRVGRHHTDPDWAMQYESILLCLYMQCVVCRSKRFARRLYFANTGRSREHARFFNVTDGSRLRWHLPQTRPCVCLWRDVQRKSVRGGREVVQIASSLAAVPRAIFDFQRFDSFRLATWSVTFASTLTDLMPHCTLVALATPCPCHTPTAR